jgi:hypothetical protein
MLVQCLDNANNPLNYIQTLEIRSSRDSSLLWSLQRAGVVEVRNAGDCDGDGKPDLLLLCSSGPRWIEVWSTGTSTQIWMAIAPPVTNNMVWGRVLVTDIDLDGDGLKDVLIGTGHSLHSTIYAYNNAGALLYSKDYLSIGRIAYSACKMGDFNNDGKEDFLLGCEESTGRGMMTLTSGVDSSDIRISYGFAAGDSLINHATNLGDIDGDGVADYMGFPSPWTQSGLTVQFSGATGNVIRHWIDYAGSVVAGPDFDLDRDGVPDILVSNQELVAPNTAGRSRAISGRDGTVLWQVDNQQSVLGGNVSYSTYGWAWYAFSHGTWPGRGYPTLSWMEADYYGANNGIGNWPGRVRSFGAELLGQGPLVGTACSTSGVVPMIGARNIATGARVTIANAPPAAFAVLNVATSHFHKQFVNLLPVSLASFLGDTCGALMLPEASAWRVTGSGPGIDSGYAAVDMPFQLSTATTGTDLVAQWLVFDPATLAFAATELHHLHGH